MRFFVHFVSREIPVQRLCFSAFDLTFGRDVKGCLQLILLSIAGCVMMLCQS